MSNIQTNQRLGILIAFIGGFVISWDIPNILLAESDPWLMVFMRGAGIALVSLIIWLYIPSLHKTPVLPLKDRDFIEISIFYTVNFIFFTLAVYNTTTANLVFILAFNPMIAAVFAWWLIGEKPHFYTWLTILITIVGVAVIVGEGIENGNFLGDFYALVCATSLAYGITRIRKSGKDMSLTPGFGGFLGALLVLPIVAFSFEMPGSVPWALVNVLVLVPLAGICLALAPTYIPAPQAAMFYLLETVLAPLWVWMVFGEIVTTQTLIGGAIILAAVLGHSAWQLGRSTQPA